MDYGYQVAHFEPGPEHMDGRRALMYARIRHPDSDFMRIRRQQAVVTAMAVRLRERGDLRNLFSLDKLVETMVGYVQTDIPKEQMLNLAWAFREYDMDEVERYTVTENMVTMGVGNDPYALLPNYAALDELTASFLDLPAQHPD
jgi:anionic cell wall polymer biosynthesis LytR-Cps2A-Psr (LCP) family protein